MPPPPLHPEFGISSTHIFNINSFSHFTCRTNFLSLVILAKHESIYVITSSSLTFAKKNSRSKMKNSEQRERCVSLMNGSETDFHYRRSPCNSNNKYNIIVNLGRPDIWGAFMIFITSHTLSPATINDFCPILLLLK